MESIGSERLRKAIERNRRKQGKRSTPTPSPAIYRNNDKENRYELGTRQTVRYREPQKSRIKVPQWIKTLKWPKTFSATRGKSVLLILGWCFNLFLFFQLIISNDGVLDFFRLQAVLKAQEMDRIKIEEDNRNLKQEIQKILTSAQYQKNLAREHLGVIESSEFLLLFAQEGESSSQANEDDH